MRTPTTALAGIVGVLALFASASATSASTEAVCTFTAHANAAASPMAWVGGNGGFGFDSDLGACTSPSSAESFSTVGALTTNGTYADLVCGTNAPGGAVTGQATLDPTKMTSITGPQIGGTGTLTIPIVAGQGIVTGTFTDNETPSVTSPLAGYLEILPNGTGGQSLAPIFGGPANHAVLAIGFGSVVPGIGGVCLDHYAVAGSIVIPAPGGPNLGGGGTGSQSGTCSPTASTTVINGTTGGIYTMLRVQSGSSTGGHIWVCARVADGSTGAGGWIDVNPGSGPVVNQPPPDGNYGACQNPASLGYGTNTFPHNGPGPLSSEQVGPASWMVDVYRGTGPSGSQVWVCASVSDGSTPVGERVIVSESPIGFTQPPSVTPHPDS